MPRTQSARAQGARPLTPQDRLTTATHDQRGACLRTEEINKKTKVQCLKTLILRESEKIGNRIEKEKRSLLNDF